MTVIGVYSSAPQMGKTALARAIEDQLSADVRVERLPFASTLKQMAAPLVMALNGHPILLYCGDKSQKLGDTGITLRRMLQTLGTEWGRGMIHPDVWVMAWANEAHRHLERGRVVIVEDVRFPNEYAAVQKLGGVVVRVDRAQAEFGPQTEHASEGALDDHEFFQTVRGPLADMPEAADRLIESLRDKGFLDGQR